MSQMLSIGHNHFDQQRRKEGCSSCSLCCIWCLWHVLDKCSSIQMMHTYGIYLGTFVYSQKTLNVYKNRNNIPIWSFPFCISLSFTRYNATLCMHSIASNNAHLVPMVKLPTAALHAHILMIETLWAQWDSFCSWSCSLSPFPLTAVLAVYAVCSV